LCDKLAAMGKGGGVCCSNGQRGRGHALPNVERITTRNWKKLQHTFHAVFERRKIENQVTKLRGLPGKKGKKKMEIKFVVARGGEPPPRCTKENLARSSTRGGEKETSSR